MPNKLLKLQEYRESIYKAHAEFILTNHLEPWIRQHTNNRQTSCEQLNTTKILVVDDRPTETLRFSIANTLLMTGLSMTAQIMTTKKKFRQMKNLFCDLEGWVNIAIISSNRGANISRSDYNNMLKMPEFWINQNAEKLLIIQADSLVIKPIDNRFYDYDYIGAPWNPGRHVSTDFPVYSSPGRGELLRHQWETIQFNPGLDPRWPYGNGGLSIRSSKCMAQICESEQSFPQEPEDVFFSRHIRNYSNKIASLETAERFSCESRYTESTGAHASHLYLKACDQAKIYERHFKSVVGLIDSY